MRRTRRPEPYGPAPTTGRLGQLARNGRLMITAWRHLNFRALRGPRNMIWRSEYFHILHSVGPCWLHSISAVQGSSCLVEPPKNAMGNAAGSSPQALPYAHPADLLRADQKDEDARMELRKMALEASEVPQSGDVATAFERLIDPFVSGVYAGDPSTLSAEAATGRVQVLEKNAGSLVAGAIKLFQDRASKPSEPRDPRLPEVKGQTVGSFRNGLKQFSDALCDDVAKHGSPVRLNWKLTKLAYDKQTGVHVLDYDTPEGPKQLRSKSLILTAPSYVAAPLLKEVCSPAAEALEGIRYPRVAAVTVEYHRSAFREPAHGKGVVNGFGQLHPRSQGIRTLGTIYSSSLFPNRMPDDDKIMLLHYIGGARDPELFGGIEDLSEGQLVEATHKDTVQTMLHESEASRLPKALGVRVWDRAIPQLEVGHQKRLDTVKETLAAEGVKGVYLAGNYVGGVALGRCVEFGIEIAKEVVDFVKEAKISQPA
eukprot:symbB.v1.2.024537.t1/scaffold2328.1/size82197/2